MVQQAGGSMLRTALAVTMLAAIPAAAAAQRTTADSTRTTTQRDSTAMVTPDSAGRAGATSRRAGMGRSATNTPQGATREEVRQLQTALNAAGYDVGTPDGIMGPRTRRAAARARRERNVAGTDVTELLNALDAETGTGGTRRRDAAAREGRPTRDSSTARPDSAVRHDSASPPPTTPPSAPPRER
jgi:peptidoglycan hydrolase-like protein with peptidoglycan-binding domain